MKTQGTIYRLVKLPFTIGWFCFTLWLFVIMKIISFSLRIFNQMVMPKINYLFEHFFVARIIKSCLNLIRNLYEKCQQYITQLTTKREAARSPLLRHRLSQQHVSDIFDSASANPDQITENEKVLLLMQKMRRLEQTTFQESVDRRKAEQELFDIKIEMNKKNELLVKQKKEFAQNLNKIKILNLQVAEKNELLQKSNKYVSDLQQQIKQMKAKIEELINKQPKQIASAPTSIQTSTQGNIQQQQVDLNQKHEDTTATIATEEQASNENQNENESKQETDSKKQGQKVQDENLVQVKKQIIVKNNKKKKKVVMNN